MLAFAVYRNGVPLEKWPEDIGARSCCLYTAAPDGRPLERAYDVDYGRLACYCPEGVERRLFIRYPVRDFGDPILRTRALRTGPFLRNLAVELARGRAELIAEEQRKIEAAGLTLSATVRERVAAAETVLARAVALEEQGDPAGASAAADDALAISVPAGEELAVEASRLRMKGRSAAGGLKDFLLGCTPYTAGMPEPRQLCFHQAFNYTTLGFYLNGVEREPGQVDHSGLLRLARDLRGHGVKLKGHPLVWTYTPCLPAFYRGMDFNTCCDVFRRRIRRDVPPFEGLIDYWDVINEAHDTPWANSGAFTSDQMVELTHLAAAETRAAAPGARLVVNICLPFGDYAAGAPGRRTPLEYLRACLAAGVDFDIVGVQFYFGSGLFQYCWDMLEIARILDEYRALGKEIHITELGTPSAMGADPNAMIHEGNEVGLWHRAWSEATQADWVEQFYTICMANPAINAATWWGFSDATPVFWPHSGLLRKDDTPKESFRRLLALRRWMR